MVSLWSLLEMMLGHFQDFRDQGLHAPKAGGLGSIPGQGARSHMLQLIVHMPQLKIPRAATKTGATKKKKKIVGQSLLS